MGFFYIVTFVLVICSSMHVDGADEIFKEVVWRCANVCKQAPNCIGCCADVPGNSGTRWNAYGVCFGPANNRQCECAVTRAKQQSCAEKGGRCHNNYTCPNGGRNIGSCPQRNAPAGICCR